jgi:hypothetical protein
MSGFRPNLSESVPPIIAKRTIFYPLRDHLEVVDIPLVLLYGILHSRQKRKRKLQYLRILNNILEKFKLEYLKKNFICDARKIRPEI